MRTQHLCGALLIACLAACAGESSAPEATESPRAAATDSTRAAADMFKRAAAEQRGDEAAAVVGGTRLKEALPGGVLPDFDHVVASDLSTRQVHATRTVTLRVRGVDARTALGELASAFTAAGFEAGAIAGDKDTLLQEFWTAGQARGVAAVSAGGIRIGLMARDYKPGSESAREGFPALVVVTVNSP